MDATLRSRGAAPRHCTLTESDENAAKVGELAARCRLIVPDAGTIEFYVRARNEIERARSVPQTIEKREGLNHDLWIAALCLQYELPLVTHDSLFDQVSGLRVIHW